MATHDYIISNASGAAVRADLNNALAAIATNNSSATEPTTTYAYQWWADTGSSPTVMKLRNAANSGWITLFQLDGEWTVVPFENGTAAAPSIYFKDSGTDTGIYSPGTDQVGISAGGTSRFEVSTSATTSTLPVVHPLGAVGTPSITFTGDLNTGIWSPAADTVAVSTNGTRAITIDSSQRLGIGNNAPQATLDVAVTRSATVDSAIFGTTGTGVVGDANRILIKNVNTLGGQNQGVGIGGVLAASASNDAHLVFYSNGGGIQERARIDSSGRLLVGTSTSRSWSGISSQFQIENTGAGSIASQSIIANTADTLGGFLLLGKSRGTSLGSNTVVQNNDIIGKITFSGADGSALIQGAAIAAEVDGTPGANDMPGRLVFSTTADAASSPTERARINSTGTASFYGLDDVIYARSNRPAGGIYATFVGVRDATSTTNGTITFLVYTNGNVQNTNGSYTTISDVKLKENIIDASSQWDDLKAIKIRNWNFKEETGHETHRQIGPIAQELETVCPGLVFETPDRDEDGNETGEVTKGVNQSVLYMKAVKALQEAMERIEALEAKVAALESA